MKKSVFLILIKCILSCIAIAIIFINIFVPNVKIDYTSILLLIIAALPWMGNLKSLEIFNLGKFEWFSKEQKESITSTAEVLEQSQSTQKSYSFLYTENIPMVLVQLRIELEKRLNKLCIINSIDESRYMNVRRMMDILFKKGIIDAQERSLILDLLPAMNMAVHGQLDNEYSDNAAWLLDVAEILLGSIDEKINNYEKKASRYVLSHLRLMQL